MTQLKQAVMFNVDPRTAEEKAAEVSNYLSSLKLDLEECNDEMEFEENTLDKLRDRRDGLMESIEEAEDKQ